MSVHLLLLLGVHGTVFVHVVQNLLILLPEAGMEISFWEVLFVCCSFRTPGTLGVHLFAGRTWALLYMVHGRYRPVVQIGTNWYILYWNVEHGNLFNLLHSVGTCCDVGRWYGMEAFLHFYMLYMVHGKSSVCCRC